jgi:hypothetical protein
MPRQVEGPLDELGPNGGRSTGCLHYGTDQTSAGYWLVHDHRQVVSRDGPLATDSCDCEPRALNPTGADYVGCALKQCADGVQLGELSGQRVVLLEPIAFRPARTAPGPDQWVERRNDSTHENLLVVEADGLATISSPKPGRQGLERVLLRETKVA